MTTATGKIWKRQSSRRADTVKEARRSHSVTVMSVAVLLLVLSLCGCSDEKVLYSNFKTLPEEGWWAKLALHYDCERTDSAGLEDVTVSVRHDVSYAYRTLELVADLIGESGSVVRRRVSIPVTDEYGNWAGSGFGSLFQCDAVVMRGVEASAVSKVVLWQVMPGSGRLKGLTEVGVKITETAVTDNDKRMN